MSVSDHSTLSVTREHDGLLDSETYGIGDLPVNSYGKSPYIDAEIISLDVGQTQTRYRVHRAVLSQSAELNAKPALKLWGEKTNDTILLPELDETTAHTLVHYLYTGRYQTLQAYDLAEKSAIPRYKLSTCVYCAAVRYRLPGLADLAKERITSFGEDLSIFDILEVTREDAFPLLPDDELWLPAYLEDAIKGAVAEDPGLFMKPGFVDQVEGDRRFRQVVMKAIVNTYSQAPAVQAPQPAVKPSHREDVPVDVHSASSATAIDADADADRDSMSNAAQESVKLDDIEPLLASPPSPEPFTDELGFQNSKTYQAMGQPAAKKNEVAAPEGQSSSNRKIESATSDVQPTSKKTEIAAAAEAAPAPANAKAHLRADSAVLFEDVIAAPALAPASASVAVEKDKESPAALPVAVEDVDGTANTTSAPAAKKGKKKKGKKGAAAAATTTTASVAAPTATAAA